MMMERDVSAFENFLNLREHKGVNFKLMFLPSNLKTPYYRYAVKINVIPRKKEAKVK